ncbi:hypothetical protein Gotri_025293 [Gossypium trilobum]|uniref:Uncharacterized protein n=1 Tax=Gossypium trilobum TaxID=34281 RepID=A0A7J9FM35_9ROSI|nr:hypothetical protein [Gossypium trilobum]MBA0786377.1 hypothetical protein [Gossypium trilobum]
MRLSSCSTLIMGICRIYSMSRWMNSYSRPLLNIGTLHIVVLLLERLI